MELRIFFPPVDDYEHLFCVMALAPLSKVKLNGVFRWGLISSVTWGKKRCGEIEAVSPLDVIPSPCVFRTICSSNLCLVLKVDRAGSHTT